MGHIFVDGVVVKSTRKNHASNRPGASTVVLEKCPAKEAAKVTREADLKERLGRALDFELKQDHLSQYDDTTTGS